MQYILEGRDEWKPRQSPDYMNKMMRNHVNTTYKARFKMPKVKTKCKK